MLQVLISTMNQKDHSLLSKMNIQSDAVVVNQADQNSVESFEFEGNKITWINMSSRGIGLSRTTALLHSTADIVLFADDDMVYYDGYKNGVLDAFKEQTTADVICFNINLVNSNKNIGGHRNNKKNKRLHTFNSMRYGACVIGARRKALLRNRLSFSLLFGGGAPFNSGEDSIFIKDCIDSGLRIFSSTFFLADVDDSTSSWYNGIDDNFFIHRGAALYSAFPKMYLPIFAYYSLRLKKLDSNYTCSKIFLLMLNGKKSIKNYK